MLQVKEGPGLPVPICSVESRLDKAAQFDGVCRSQSLTACQTSEHG